MRKILAFGEILWDILPDKTVLGGAPFNFALRVNSLGDRALFVSRLGHDELGEQAREQAQHLGLDTALMQTDPTHPTGAVLVSFDDNHLPDYLIKPNAAYDFIQVNDKLLQIAAGVECLAFGTLIQRGASQTALRELIDASPNAVKFYDINLRKNCYSPETILYSLDQANILKINEDEVHILFALFGLTFKSLPHFCDMAIREWALDYVLVTFGDKGAFAQSALGEEVYVPGHKITLVDSVGAGDAFSAAFIHKLLNGAALADACAYGNALGALVASTPGATAAISPEQIEALLRSNSDRLYHREFS